jgi:hypothetical protein
MVGIIDACVAKRKQKEDSEFAGSRARIGVKLVGKKRC